MMGPARGDVPATVIDAFRFDGAPSGVEPLPGGHIHRNVLVTSPGGRYVLQSLNGRVFPDIGALLANVERVTAHLEATGRPGPTLVETTRGTLSYRESDGSVWRAFRYLEGTVGRTVLSGPDDAFEAGRAFADYRVAMADLPGPPLTETIARFHDLRHRLGTLDAVAAADRTGRRAAVGHELGRARELGRHVVEALDSRATPTPVRTVHNDAKLSNVRFDARTGLATCVVDLDTTMPGHVQCDVGELVRTVATHAPEDARDDTTVDFDLDLVGAVAAGYVAGDLELEPSEVDVMALAGPQMAVENGVRFLTDHLAGDRYFAIDRPDQNLDRCRTQLQLTELMLDAHADVAACFARAARHPATVRPDIGNAQESR
jgi:N-acetylhexosamine 1-kinase